MHTDIPAGAGYRTLAIPSSQSKERRGYSLLEAVSRLCVCVCVLGVCDESTSGRRKTSRSRLMSGAQRVWEGDDLG